MSRLTTDAAKLLVPKFVVALTEGVLRQDYYRGHIHDEAAGRRYTIGILHLAENALINSAITAMPNEEGLSIFIANVQEEFVAGLRSFAETVTLSAVCPTEEEVHRARLSFSERSRAVEPRSLAVDEPMTLQAAYYLLQPVRGLEYSNLYLAAAKAGLSWPGTAIAAMIDCSQSWICGRVNRPIALAKFCGEAAADTFVCCKSATGFYFEVK